jgi:hypothetical protein
VIFVLGRGATPPREVLGAILAVLLHHGGRVDSERLGAIFATVGVSRRDFIDGFDDGREAGLFHELGDRVLLCRRGWTALAEKAPELAELARRRPA